jgi:pyridoxal phosphate enzyme (YggS family)
MLSDNISKIQHFLADKACTLVAVTKTHPLETLQEAYNLGLRIFGENRVQEMVSKFNELPKDIEWHQIGHLQSNKVKMIAPFVKLIHSVDSRELLVEINKQAIKNNRTIDCLLQIYIASEDTKFGFSYEEAESLLKENLATLFPNVRIIGLMGMATNTDNEQQVKNEFKSLKTFFDTQKSTFPELKVLSMGMSGDYSMAIEEGSNMIRVGSAIFGSR